MSNKKVVAFSFIACGAAAILSATPAHAAFATLESGTQVIALREYENAYTVINCGNGDEDFTEFFILQRMMVDGGPPTWVPTETAYLVGRYRLRLSRTCGGYNIYDVEATP